MLPDDAGKKFCFNNVSFPVFIDYDGVKKTLDLDLSNMLFVLTIDIPLKQFNGVLSPDNLDDPTLQSKVWIKNLQHEYDVFEGPCTCDPKAETHISLLSSAEIIDKIGVKQDVWLYGEPDDC